MLSDAFFKGPLFDHFILWRYDLLIITTKYDLLDHFDKISFLTVMPDIHHQAPLIWNQRFFIIFRLKNRMKCLLVSLGFFSKSPQSCAVLLFQGWWTFAFHKVGAVGFQH